SARRIALYGVGREGLMMKGFAMRLFHLGLNAHVVGNMSAPAISSGDLLIVSAGPGQFSTVAALVGVARSAGAKTLCVTAQPNGAVPKACDLALVLPAQTMADDSPADASTILPMGSLYEGVQYVFFELMVLLLRERLGETPETMRARHTNLE
ncbi:MAG TPA: SIS domain-containing protein, partial [Aestuariivirga sp.]|nr:SIS domain-containing protein [Aestuariivirga sp.]